MAELTNDEKLDLQATLADWLDRHGLCSGTIGNLDEGIDVVMTWEQVRGAVELLGGKVLADREGLMSALSGDDTSPCAWHDCEFEPGAMFGHPHSGTCPLREGS